MCSDRPIIESLRWGHDRVVVCRCLRGQANILFKMTNLSAVHLESYPHQWDWTGSATEGGAFLGPLRGVMRAVEPELTVYAVEHSFPVLDGNRRATREECVIMILLVLGLGHTGMILLACGMISRTHGPQRLKKLRSMWSM